MGALGTQRAQQLQEAIASGGIAGLDALGLTEAEYDLLLRMNEATIYAVLESWTLEDPLPASASEVGEMQGGVFDALQIAVAQLNLTGDERFSIEAIDDLTSPTGASAGSNAPSAKAVARRAPSDRRKPSGGRSTASAKRSG
jgi:hypothetical protein